MLLTSLKLSFSRVGTGLKGWIQNCTIQFAIYTPWSDEITIMRSLQICFCPMKHWLQLIHTLLRAPFSLRFPTAYISCLYNKWFSYWIYLSLPLWSLLPLLNLRNDQYNYVMPGELFHYMELSIFIKSFIFEEIYVWECLWVVDNYHTIYKYFVRHYFIKCDISNILRAININFYFEFCDEQSQHMNQTKLIYQLDLFRL